MLSHQVSRGSHVGLRLNVTQAGYKYCREEAKGFIEASLAKVLHTPEIVACVKLGKA